MFDASVFAARTVIILICLIVAFRLFGRRQVGQMNIYDLATVMAVANAVQNAMTGGRGALTVGLASAGALLVTARLATLLFQREPQIESRALGTPKILVNHGERVDANLRKEGITDEQLHAALREHGLQTPLDAKLVVLEVDGSLSVIPNDP